VGILQLRNGIGCCEVFILMGTLEQFPMAHEDRCDKTRHVTASCDWFSNADRDYPVHIHIKHFENDSGTLRRHQPDLNPI